MSSLNRKAFTADGERTPKLLGFAAALATQLAVEAHLHVIYNVSLLI